MALCPIFRVVRSSPTDLSMLVARALKIGQIADLLPKFVVFSQSSFQSCCLLGKRLSGWWDDGQG
jgi:hypothetical protein